MEEQKKLLIEKAINKHDKIYPCGKCSSLQECFTMQGDQLLFWYNTEGGSTHVISGQLEWQKTNIVKFKISKVRGAVPTQAS